MKNFSFTHNGQKFWYSRSLACGLLAYAFNKNHELCVLANKRGATVEYNPNKWNIPGGFIDFDETDMQCAIRETFEETGINVVNLSRSAIHFLHLDTTPNKSRQTMTSRHVVFLHDSVEDLEKMFTTNNSEPDEVAEIKFIPCNTLDEYDWCDKQVMYILMGQQYVFKHLINSI